jgi:hypothetical protein
VLVKLLELAIVEQDPEARARANSLVVPALGAHLEIVLQRLAPYDLAAVDALEP